MYQLKKSISAAALRLSSFIMAVLRTAKHNINRAVTFILAVILMTGSFAGYLTPVVSAADDEYLGFLKLCRRTKKSQNEGAQSAVRSAEIGADRRCAAQQLHNKCYRVRNNKDQR